MRCKYVCNMNVQKCIVLYTKYFWRTDMMTWIVRKFNPIEFSCEICVIRVINADGSERVSHNTRRIINQRTYTRKFLSDYSFESFSFCVYTRCLSLDTHSEHQISYNARNYDKTEDTDNSSVCKHPYIHTHSHKRTHILYTIYLS